MYILESVKSCSDPGVIIIITIVKRVLSLIQMLGPILAIVSLGILFTQHLINPENKKLKNRIKNSVMALILLFLVPYIVNMVMLLCDDSFVFSTCWNYEETVQVFGSKTTYIELDNSRPPQSIITFPGDYDPAPSNPETNNDGMGGKAKKIKIDYNVKDSKGRCGKGGDDVCIQVATVQYPSGTVKYYMGRQNNSGLLGGSCRSHAFMCGLNATKDTYYSTLDLQNYLYSTGDQGVLKGQSRFTKAINHYDVNATAYFNETSISESISLAKKALDNGQPVIIFVAGSKCSDLADSHHALLLLGYDNNGDVVFIDSCGRYANAKKRNLKELGQCMSDDSIAKNWMRMVIFSFDK